MRLFLLFLVVPIVEIALFLNVGNLIGFWPTIAAVILTAFLGTVLVRAQGLAVLSTISQGMSSPQKLPESLAHGAMILVSGALLLTPGFFTDAVGFALLVPAIRMMVFWYLRTRFISSTVVQTTDQPDGVDPVILDGDYSEVDEDAPKPTHKPSQWTHH